MMLQTTGTSSSSSSNRRRKRSIRCKERVEKKKKEKSLVEQVNALSPEEFSARYFSPLTSKTTTTRTAMKTSPSLWSNSPHLPPSQQQQQQYLSLKTWAEMEPWCREACIDLVEETSLEHYRGSEVGWSRSKKLKEMRHPAMRYLLLLLVPSSSSSPSLFVLPSAAEQNDEEVKVDVEVGGFLSFMITEEDGREVVYCYELHLQPRLQGQGVGKRMMGWMEMMGARVGVEKAMLTVFRVNERALRAYRGWGYGVDEFSPEPRTLRDGTVKEAGYVILSKERGGFAQEESE